MLLLTLPILIPLAAAAICLIAWKRPRTQAGIALAAMIALSGNAVLLLQSVSADHFVVMQVGGWDAPFGITLVADRFAALLVTLVSVAGLAATIASISATDWERARHGHFPLLLALVAAVSGAFLAGDLFNLYVWFEALLLSSFVLLTLGGERAQLEGAVKYVTLNLVSSVFFLAAVGLLYGITGTLNFAHLALRIDGLNDPTMATAAGTLLLAAFAVKAAAFPFFFWLPASYHTPPPVVTALFAAVLTKVGVYALIRTSTLLFDHAWSVLGPALLVIAGCTMVIGVLGAASQSDMRRILAFHSVSQVGYMLMGLAIALAALAGATTGAIATDPQVVSTTAIAAPVAGAPTPDALMETASAAADAPALLSGLDPDRAALLALAGAIYFILHHGLVKMNLFLVSAAVLQRRGTTRLKELGGMLRSQPLLAIMFLVAALALAGIPVLSGFWAKLSLIYGGLLAGSWAIVGAALVVSILTLFSMIKIWNEVFWKDPIAEYAGKTERMPEPLPTTKIAPLPVRRGSRIDPAARLIAPRFSQPLLLAVILGVNIIIVGLGLGAGPIFDFALLAADDLLRPQGYIDAVLGTGFEEAPTVAATPLAGGGR